MDNQNLPAYPACLPDIGFLYAGEATGFTKLELASLMMAQGLLEPGMKWEDILNNGIPSKSVALAEIILREANK